mmetsp:Transcript_10546/g.23354  ORF Transcript_10546/g.23354 Transcript_10546/m.23354 type:complete len:382 (-) Transcript_10546:6-1151(-)
MRRRQYGCNGSAYSVLKTAARGADVKIMSYEDEEDDEEEVDARAFCCSCKAFAVVLAVSCCAAITGDVLTTVGGAMDGAAGASASDVVVVAARVMVSSDGAITTGLGADVVVSWRTTVVVVVAVVVAVVMAAAEVSSFFSSLTKELLLASTAASSAVVAVVATTLVVLMGSVMNISEGSGCCWAATATVVSVSEDAMGVMVFVIPSSRAKAGVKNTFQPITAAAAAAAAVDGMRNQAAFVSMGDDDDDAVAARDFTPKAGFTAPQRLVVSDTAGPTTRPDISASRNCNLVTVIIIMVNTSLLVQSTRNKTVTQCRKRTSAWFVPQQRHDQSQKKIHESTETASIASNLLAFAPLIIIIIFVVVAWFCLRSFDAVSVRQVAG